MTLAFWFFSLSRDYLTELADWTTGAFTLYEILYPSWNADNSFWRQSESVSFPPGKARKALARIASPSPCVIVGQRQRNTIPASLWPMDSMVALMSFFFRFWLNGVGFINVEFHQSLLKHLSSNQNTRAPSGGLPGGLFFEKSSSTKTAVCLALPCQVKSWSFWPPWRWRRCL